MADGRRVSVGNPAGWAAGQSCQRGEVRQLRKARIFSGVAGWARQRGGLSSGVGSAAERGVRPGVVTARMSMIKMAVN